MHQIMQVLTVTEYTQAVHRGHFYNKRKDVVDKRI